jgi:hypothetical protein
MTSREILDVARHLTLAAPLVGPQSAVPHLQAASYDALSRFANDQAEAHPRTALGLIGQVRDPAQRAELAGPARGRLAPTRTLAVVPLAYVARRTGDLRIGIVTHVVLNSIDVVVLLRVAIAS